MLMQENILIYIYYINKSNDKIDHAIEEKQGREHGKNGFVGRKGNEGII